MLWRRKYIIPGLSGCLDANIEHFQVRIKKANKDLCSLLKGYELLWTLKIDFVCYCVTVCRGFLLYACETLVTGVG